MKVSLKLTAAVLAAAVLAFGCSTGSGSSTADTGNAAIFVAPDVGSVNNVEVPAGAKTAFTKSQGTEAQDMYIAASNAINYAISTELSKASKSVSNARGAALGEPVTTSYNFTVTPASGGTVVCTGSMIETFDSAKSSVATVAANTRYKGIMSVAYTGDVGETITNAKVTDAAHTYTINGIAKNTCSINFGFDLLTGTESHLNDKTDWKYYLNFGLGIGAGSAISVVRDDGLYAKFLITYAANYSKADISCADDNDTNFTNNMYSYLEAQNAMLYVYDKDNKLILTKQLPMSTAYDSSILSNMGNVD